MSKDRTREWEARVNEAEKLPLNAACRQVMQRGDARDRVGSLPNLPSCLCLILADDGDDEDDVDPSVLRLSQAGLPRAEDFLGDLTLLDPVRISKQLSRYVEVEKLPHMPFQETLNLLTRALATIAPQEYQSW